METKAMNNARTLTDEQRATLNRWAMFGSDSYPIHRDGKLWRIERGCGEGLFHAPFKTKREAVSAWERYIGLLRDYAAGRIENPKI